MKTKQKHIAEALGITPQHLSRLRKLADYPLDGDLEEVKEWYEDRKILRGTNSDQLKHFQLEYLKNRIGLTIARRKLLERKYEAIKGDLVARAEVEELLKEVKKRLKTALKGFPEAVAAKANPNHPELAREALSDGLEQLNL